MQQSYQSHTISNQVPNHSDTLRNACFCGDVPKLSRTKPSPRAVIVMLRSLLLKHRTSVPEETRKSLPTSAWAVNGRRAGLGVVTPGPTIDAMIRTVKRWKRMAIVLGFVAVLTTAFASHWWHQARWIVCPVCREAKVNQYHWDLERLGK